jgi:phosphoesterase RecJ-like protein
VTHTEIEKVKELLASHKNIVIVTHKNPDGDAMGSSLGLYNYLTRKNHNVKVITPNGYPTFLHWLPGHDKAIDFSKSRDMAEARIKKAEIIFCLDFNGLRRIGDVGEYVKKSKATKIMVDHHPQPEKFADYLFHNKRSSSTAELIFDLITLLGDKKLMNRKSANCLYTGIMTDTLNFRISTTSAHTHEVAAELINAGAQNTVAYVNVFDTNSEDRVRMLGYALQKMKVFKEYNAAFISLSATELKKFNFQKGDTEGLVNYPLSIEGVCFSALFTETKGEIRISFRSKGNFDVNKFARKNFNGGGHTNAAGGEGHGTLDEAVLRFVNLLPDYKDELLK